MADGPRIFDMSAAALGRQLAAGLIDAVDLCDAFLDRIATYDDQAVYIRVTADRARAEARASAARHREGRPLGPLDGVPVAFKDLFDMAGETTTAGSACYREARPAREDAAAVASLAAAGMVSLGKTNLTELAFSGLGLNPHFGTPRNPHDRETPRIPGGSSSGSAVAVAAGLAPCAIGTDTGGSVRIPAALNGLVGFKPSTGRIAAAGCFPLARSLDTIGPLTRDVEDAILVDAALRGVMPAGFEHAEVRGLRMVVATNLFQDDIEDAVAANFDRALGRLSAVGAKIEHRRLDLLDAMQRVATAHGTLVAVEAWHQHHALLASEGDRIDPRVAARIRGGERMSGRDVIAIQEARQRLAAELSAELAGALLVLPTVAHTAPEIAPLDADPELYHRVNLKTLRNTAAGNFLGTCGLAVPNGSDGRGLPTSILFSAPGGADDRLLAYGRALERAVGTMH